MEHFLWDTRKYPFMDSCKLGFIWMSVAENSKCSTDSVKIFHIEFEENLFCSIGTSATSQTDRQI
jgi:hypothetical protein